MKRLFRVRDKNSLHIVHAEAEDEANKFVKSVTGRGLSLNSASAVEITNHEYEQIMQGVEFTNALHELSKGNANGQTAGKT